jgi:hypothetical protein
VQRYWCHSETARGKEQIIFHGLVPSLKKTNWVVYGERL